MKIAEVKVAKTTCETTRLVPIPKGIVGATVSIEYTDSAWDGLQKTVVFRSAVAKDVLNAGSEVTIPAEVVSRAGVNLYMGVYGVDAANNVVIPTIWAELGLVNGAAAPSGDTSTDPSLPVWAQIQSAIGNLDDLDTDAKSSLVAAVNEALTRGGGEVDPATVHKIVDDYLKANPPGAGADGKDGITPTMAQTALPQISRSARSQHFRRAATRRPAWAARQRIRCSILVSRGARTGRAAALATGKRLRRSSFPTMRKKAMH